MYVIAAAIHGMQFPAANLAMVDDNSVNDLTLSVIENNGKFRHHQRGFTQLQGIGFAESNIGIEPSAVVAGQPSAIGRPCCKDGERHGRFTFVGSYRFCDDVHYRMFPSLARRANG